MKVLAYLFILTSFNSYAYDPAKLNQDLELIQNEFLPTATKQAKRAKANKLVRSRTLTKEEEIKDLESLYFDEVKMKAAGRKRLRSR